MSDKDDILNLALEELLTIYLEGRIINKDVYGYWEILEDELFNTSILAFNEGLVNFYDRLSKSDSSELVTYDIKFRIRVCNCEFIRAAANEVWETFKNNVVMGLDTGGTVMINTGATFDFNNEPLTKFEQILFLFFVYYDKIQLNALLQRKADQPVKRGGFNVSH